MIVLTTINLRTEFEVSSFIHSRNKPKNFKVITWPWPRLLGSCHHRANTGYLPSL